MPEPALPSRRTVLTLAAAATLPALLPRAARAQAYPARPVRIVVPFTPGGGNDLFARLIGQSLQERLGQTFVIENRPGGGSNIGTEAVARAPADGYTLLLTFSSNAINASLYERLPFEFLRDIEAVAGVARMALLVLVNAGLPVHTFPEFIAYAKARPGTVNMASAGTGTPSHVAAELIKLTAGIDMVHVPYRGSTPALTDLIGGRVQALLMNPGSSYAHVRSGKLRALAISSATRAEALPDIPAIAEFLPGFEATLFYGIGAPRGTPAAIVSLLNREINTALADPKLRARLAESDGVPLIGTPAEIDRLLADETEKWRKVIRASNIRAE